MLQHSIAALDQFQTPESFNRNLESVKKHYHEAVHGPGTYLPQNKLPPQAPPAAPPRPGFVKNGFVFKGGDPSEETNWAPVR